MRTRGTPRRIRWGPVALGLSVAGAAVAVPAVAGQLEGGGSDLETLRGLLRPCGGNYCVDNRRVDFGPPPVLGSITAPHDFDGSGARGSLAEEITGLLGTTVVLEVAVGSEGDVHTLNGMQYRPLSGPPAWASSAVGQDAAAGARGQREAGVAEDGTALTGLAGVLERCGPEYCVNGIEVDFGPRWFLGETIAPEDLDGDGTLEVLADELEGLVGLEVQLMVEAGDSGDRDVHSVNGVNYRGPRDTPPPWAGGPGDGARLGPPDNAGPPDKAGAPDNAGAPDTAGPPDNAGPPGDLPDQAAVPEDAGPPEGAGPPDTAGPPSTAGPPENVPPRTPEGDDGADPDEGPPQEAGPPA